MGLKFDQAQNNRSWQQVLVEESDHSLRTRGAKREHTFRRMYISVFVWFPAFFLLYTSLFYVGAFIDPGEIVGISHSERAAKTKTKMNKSDVVKKRTFISPLFDAFRVNKIYLRAGQSIQLSYALPKGTEFRAIIKQCKAVPVLEVFKCQVIGQQEKLIRFGNRGVLEFTVGDAGFYYFDDEVIKLPSTLLKPNLDYTIIWQRT